jgi:hypothetical protein
MLLGATSLVIQQKNKLPCQPCLYASLNEKINGFNDASDRTQYLKKITLAKDNESNTNLTTYYRKRALNNQTPSTQYETQKIIQNTVRVPSSLYLSNVAPLNAYQNALNINQKVCWNQMSDRAIKHVQPHIVGDGLTGNSTRYTITRLRPGALCPGGEGVDIKHNYYERHLNRLKGRSVLRRGPIPVDFGLEIPFHLSKPVYGNKRVKTNLVAGCVCPSDKTEVLITDLPSAIFGVPYQYVVGQKVYIITDTPFTQATIKEIHLETQSFTLTLLDGSIRNVGELQIEPYFPCECASVLDNSTLLVQAELCNNLSDQLTLTATQLIQRIFGTE